MNEWEVNYYLLWLLIFLFMSAAHEAEKKDLSEMCTVASSRCVEKKILNRGNPHWNRLRYFHLARKMHIYRCIAGDLPQTHKLQAKTI